jgi:hypothetical protein
MNIKKIMIGMVALGVIGAGVAWYLIDEKLTPPEDYVIICDNGLRIYEQIVEFEKDYLSLPSEESALDDAEMESLDLKTSNGYLGQLVVAGAMDSELIFYIKGSAVCGESEPDNVVMPRSEVLTAGENGWAYFIGREFGAKPPLPILVPGWNPETKNWDSAIWKNGVPVVMTDGTVVLYKAPNDGTLGSYKTLKADLPFDLTDANLIQPANNQKH